MANKKNISRFERVVFSKMDSSLQRVQEDMEEMGISLLDIPAMKAPVEQYLKNYYSDIDSKSAKVSGNNTLMVLGTDEVSCPVPLARSIVIYGLKKVIKDIYETLETLEETEDEKITRWAKKITGQEEVRIDFENLLVKNSSNDQMLQTLQTTWEVLNEKAEKLDEIVNSISHNAESHKAFIRDLGAARLADKKIDDLLHDLWEADDATVIDEVLKSISSDEIVKPHEKPINFFAEMLKKKLSLPANVQQELMAEVMGE